MTTKLAPWSTFPSSVGSNIFNIYELWYDKLNYGNSFLFILKSTKNCLYCFTQVKSSIPNGTLRFDFSSIHADTLILKCMKNMGNIVQNVVLEKNTKSNLGFQYVVLPILTFDRRSCC